MTDYKPLLAALSAAAALIALPGVALAQLAPGNGPVNLSADHSHMETDKATRADTTYLDGRVEILQTGRRLRCDHAKLVQAPYTDAAGNTGKQVVQMEATGNVYYVTEDSSAHGDYAVYTKADDTLKVTGNVILERGQSVGTGNLLIDKVQAGQMSLTSDINSANHGRVRAIMYPQKKEPVATAPAHP